MATHAEGWAAPRPLMLRGRLYPGHLCCSSHLVLPGLPTAGVGPPSLTCHSQATGMGDALRAPTCVLNY